MEVSLSITALEACVCQETPMQHTLTPRDHSFRGWKASANVGHVDTLPSTQNCVKVLEAISGETTLPVPLWGLTHDL